MKFINPRVMTFAGFLISFAAIIINALVLANVNNRLGAVDAETARLNSALREQTANGNEAETKFGNYRIMHHLASLVAADKRSDASGDATVWLNESLTFLFAAANEVSVTEIRRVESEAAESEESEQLYEAAKAAEESGKKLPAAPKVDEEQENDQEFESALREFETGATNDNELRRKIAAIETISTAAASAENESEFFVKLYPINKILSAKWVASVKQKQARLVELEADKTRLIKYQGYSTLAALALQMLGLMFVILKDLLERKEEAEE